VEFSITFLKIYYLAFKLVAPLILTDFFSIALIGLIVGRLEKWKSGEAIYWAFITATTVGYGDFRPKRGVSRFLAIIIAIHGLILFSILGAIAVQVMFFIAGEHLDLQALQALQE
jgi:voltage-gated potassium channel